MNTDEQDTQTSGTAKSSTVDESTGHVFTVYNQDIGPVWGYNNPNAKTLVDTGKPVDEMNKDERFLWDMHNILGILMEMDAIIEGGECFEDFETRDAIHHLSEISNFIDNRRMLVIERIATHEQFKDIKELFKFEDFNESQLEMEEEE